MSAFYQFSKSLLNTFKATTYGYCNLEAPDGDKDSTTFATTDNGLTSMFVINGTFRHVGRRRLEENVRELFGATQHGLQKVGQRLDFTYIRDKSRGADVAKKTMQPLRRSMTQRELDLGFFLDEQEESLSEDIVYEQVYVMITTNLLTLDKNAQEAAINNRNAKATKLSSFVNMADYGQNLLSAMDDLRSTHESNVESMGTALGKICSIHLMSAEDIVHSIRQESAPGFTGDKYQARLPGTRMPIRSDNDSPEEWDISNISYPSIGYQLFPLTPEAVKGDRSIVKVGNSYQAPLVVDAPPAESLPFSDFIESLPKDVPVRLTFSIETGHDQVLSKVHSKKTKAMLLAWSSSQTRGIYDAAQEIIDTSKNRLYANCSFTACTWGDDLKSAQRSKNILAKTLQNWGGIDVSEDKSDAPRVWAATLPGFSHPALRISPQFPYPVKDIIKMLPLGKVASPFDGGSVLCRSISETLYSIAPTSSRQDTWIDYFFAPPGKGKSVTMSYHNLSFLLSPVYKTLPSIAILDIGPSAENTIRLIQEALPNDKKHLAAAFKLRMKKSSAINPFDTPLGCRRPLTFDSKVLVRIVQAVLAPTGALAKTGIPMLGEFSSALVERMYAYYTDEKGFDGQPKIYETGIDSQVDETLVRLGIEAISGETTWWSLVDKLYEHGEIPDAVRAQRFAVPTLNEASEVMSEDNILKRSFGTVEVSGQQTLFDYVNTMLRAAARDLPVLASETAFDIGNARIIALDLSEVTPQGSQDFEVKQTSIMYLLGRFAVSKNFYRDAETVDEVPEAYKDFHRKQIEDMSQAPKRLVMDEIHRCVKFDSVLSQLVLDCREGRKFDVQISLASQRLDDLPEELSDLVQNFYVMSLGNEQMARRIIDKLSIHPDVVEKMKVYCQGPGKRGLYHLVVSTVRDEGDPEDDGSAVDHIVNLKQGKRMLLAQSTSAEDRNIRSRMVKLVGLNDAILLMSAEIPGGKAKPYIENRSKKGDFDNIQGNIYDDICSDIINKHGHLIK